MVYHSSLDATFAALADPTRREILSRLATGERSISDLAGRFEMSLPAVSKHIRVLERAGLARVRLEGRTRQTTLVAAPMRDAQQWIETYRQFWEFQFDQLAAYLEAGTDHKERQTWQQQQPQRRARRSKSGERSTRRGSASSMRGRKPKK